LALNCLMLWQKSRCRASPRSLRCLMGIV
jgi:hypothetical protein